MSRASDLTLFIIILQASIGFVDASGLFSEHYIDVPDNNATYTMTDLESYYEPNSNEGGITGVINDVQLYAQWALESFVIGIKIIGAVIFVLPTLISVFGIPAILATFIQVGIYYLYAIWFAQYKSGKGWTSYE